MVKPFQKPPKFRILLVKHFKQIDRWREKWIWATLIYLGVSSLIKHLVTSSNPVPFMHWPFKAGSHYAANQLRPAIYSCEMENFPIFCSDLRLVWTSLYLFGTHKTYNKKNESFSDRIQSRVFRVKSGRHWLLYHHGHNHRHHHRHHPRHHHGPEVKFGLNLKSLPKLNSLTFYCRN